MISEKLQEAFAAHIRRMPFFSFPDIAFHESGYSNLVFRVRSKGKTYAVRFSKAPALKPSVFVQYDYEKKVWKRVASLHLSPRVFESGVVVVAGRKFPYSIQEFVAGRPLNHAKDVSLLVNALYALHHHTRKSGEGLHQTGDVLNWAKKQLDAYEDKPYSKISVSVRGILAQASEHARASLVGVQTFPSCLVHNDLVSDNVLVQGKRVFFIDWGWAMHSSPAVDICGALSPFVTSWKKPLFLTPKHANTFLATYAKPLSREEKRALHDDVVRLWGAYNSMVISWILCDYAPNARSISRRAWFASPRFLEKAFRSSEKLKAQVML